MGTNKLSGARTPTGRAVKNALRSVRTRRPLARLAIVLAAEIGGAVGDGAHRVLAGGRESAGAADAESSSAQEWLRREERARSYTEEALREQREEARRAREAYRRARDEGRRAGDAGHEDAGSRSGRARCYGGRMVADYYEVLEVSPKARQAVIDKAYRALMCEEHPDRGGTKERAQLVNEAYEVLRDPTKRQAYDRQNGLIG